MSVVDEITEWLGDAWPSPPATEGRTIGWRIRWLKETKAMFESLLAELKATREAIAGKKYFTALSHGGKVATAAGDLGARFFEKSDAGPITLMAAADVSDETLAAIMAECQALEGERLLLSSTAGDIDMTGLDPATIAIILQLLQLFGPMVMDLIKRIIERRKNKNKPVVG